MASIQVSALHKRFDDFVAVNGSDFTVQHGEFFVSFSSSWDHPVAAKRQPCG
jgi:ABC-type sugar transport system ATPase subunit